VGGWYAQLVALVGAGGGPSHDGSVPRHDHIVVRQIEVRENRVIKRNDVLDALSARTLSGLLVMIDDV